MKKEEILNYTAFLLMLAFLVIALATNNVIISKLMASLSIITGITTAHYFSKQNSVFKNK